MPDAGIVIAIAESISSLYKNTRNHKFDYAINALSLFLAFVFVGAGLYKLVTWTSTVEQFERFGYAPWFIVVTVLIELVAAGLVAVHQTRSLGTTLIIIIMIAAMLSHLKAGEQGEMISPLVILILASIVSWFAPEKPTEPKKESSKTGDE